MTRTNPSVKQKVIWLNVAIAISIVLWATLKCGVLAFNAADAKTKAEGVCIQGHIDSGIERSEIWANDGKCGTVYDN